MRDNEFDDMLKDRLNDHPSPFPTDMWQRIQHGEQQKRRRFRLWYWYVFPSIAAVALIVIIPRPSNPTHPAPAPSTAATHTQPVPTHIQPAASVPQPTPTQPTSTQPTSTQPTSTQPTPISSTHNQPAATVPLSTQTSNPSAPGSTTTVPPPISAHGHTTTPAISDSPTAPTSGFSSTAATSTSRPLVLSHTNTAHMHAPKSPIPATPTISAVTTSLAMTTSRSARSYPSLRHNPPATLRCPDPNTKFSRNGAGGWYLEALASPDHPYFSQKYLYLAQPTTALSYTAGVRLVKVFPSGLSMTVGLQYSRISISKGIDTIFNAIRYFSDIDLPLLVGYQLGKNNFKVAVQAGPVLDFFSWKTEVPNSQVSDHHMGVSAFAGIDFIEQLDPRLSIFAEPYFRWQLSNTYPGYNQWPNEKINVIGIMLGVRWNLKQYSK